MASIYGYCQSFDYSHMYNIKDLRADIPPPTLNEGTIMEFLETTSEFSTFAYLVKKADMFGIFNSKSPSFSRFTLFLPRNQDIRLSDKVLRNLDKYTCRSLVLYSMADRELSSLFLRSSPIMYVNSRIFSDDLLVENTNIEYFTTVNGRKILQFDLKFNNGVVHIVDDILIPDIFDLQNDVY